MIPRVKKEWGLTQNSKTMTFKKESKVKQFRIKDIKLNSTTKLKKQLQCGYTHDHSCNFSRILGHESIATFTHSYWNMNPLVFVCVENLLA